MSLRKWLAVFLVTAIASAALVAGFNAAIDPFGLFGDRLLHWWSYDMTMNPRTAKIGWLAQNHGDYDSYIIGCSKTSSFPTELLNRYYGAKFYNMTMYGGDLSDVELTAKYILDNYGAKNIVINTGLNELTEFAFEADNMKGNLHAAVDGSNPFSFYSHYLFASPDYATRKLGAYLTKGYLVTADTVFSPATGAYDKSLRDVERIADLDSYLEKYPAFKEWYEAYPRLDAVDQAVAAIARIKEMCAAKGATFTLIVSPMYARELDLYINDDLWDFYRKVAAVTDFWDFSGYHSVAWEPRYFYDVYHARNAVGAMALARMFADRSVYVPEDFGAHVTKDNVASWVQRYVRPRPDTAGRSRQVPVLMYHNVAANPANKYEVSTEAFEAQLKALKQAGYETVSFAQLTAFVERGAPLPEKPVVMTFDDGYAGVVTTAAPLLAKYGMRAAVSVIGVSVGADTYKDTGQPIAPHFALADAADWVRAGVLEVESHSFDMHNTPELDRGHYREGVLPRRGESEQEYIRAFREDLEASRSAIESALGTPVTVYAYPYGIHTDLTEVLLAEMGIKITLTVEEGTNTVVKGLPQTLRAMKRLEVGADTSPEELLLYLGGLR
ncbi:MAG: polysaccharide deacetylase family protein [Chloroflexota bacterium]